MADELIIKFWNKQVSDFLKAKPNKKNRFGLFFPTLFQYFLFI